MISPVLSAAGMKAIGDTAPRTLPIGAYVLRKAAVAKYGARGISSLISRAAGSARVAAGRVAAGRVAAGRVAGAMRAMLTPGEIVVPPNVVANLGVGFFDRLNAARFASGGPVGMDIPAGRWPQQGKTITVNLAFGGHSVPMTTAASNESALMGMLDQLQRAMRRS
mgnify:CR=1 FL=1